MSTREPIMQCRKVSQPFGELAERSTALRKILEAKDAAVRAAIAVAALLVMFLPAVALAQTAAPIDLDDPTVVLQALAQAIVAKQWPLAASLGAVLLILAARMWGGKVWPWLLTNRGGAVLSLAFAAAESVVVAVTSGAVGLVGILTAALVLFFKNFIVYQAFKKILAPSGADLAQDAAVLAAATGAKLKVVAGQSASDAAAALNKVGK